MFAVTHNLCPCTAVHNVEASQAVPHRCHLSVMHWHYVHVLMVGWVYLCTDESTSSLLLLERINKR